jgi:hypothetical protein
VTNGDDPEKPKYGITDKGTRVLLYVLRYYTVVVIVTAVGGLALGCLFGYALTRLGVFR